MTLAILIIFLAVLLLGVPIAFVIGITSLAALIIQGTIPFNALPQYMFMGLDSFPLLAIPFFILAGLLMSRTGISARLIDFTMVLFGRMPGELAQVNIGTSIFFAGITGAAVADTAAVGTVLIPAMKKEGYPAAYSAAVTAASSCIGPIVPPSIILVVYGIAANTSIASLLIAGIIPGVLMGLSMGVVVWFQAIKHKFPRRKESYSLKKTGKCLHQSFACFADASDYRRRNHGWRFHSHRICMRGGCLQFAAGIFHKNFENV